MQKEMVRNVSYRMFIINVFIQGRNAYYSSIWKHLFLKLFLTAMANGLLKSFADSFISFDGILSIPVHFLLTTIVIKSFFSNH